MTETCSTFIPVIAATDEGRFISVIERRCSNSVYLDAFIEGNPIASNVQEMPFMAALCSKHFAEAAQIDEPDAETWVPIVGVDA